jgi:hypothetical protein
MNNKDKEAFEKWRDNNFSKLIEVGNKGGLEKLNDNLAWCWQAAVDCKQKEIEEDEDRLRNHMNSIGYRELKRLRADNNGLKENINGTKMKQMNDRIEDLLAENKKLREALELIAGEQEFFDEISDRSKTKMAREALKEVGEE